MPDEPKKPPFALVDAKKQRDLAHLQRIRDLFKEHPDIVGDLLIVSADGHVILHPEELTVMGLVGVLECAKHEVLSSADDAGEEEDEDDS